MHRLIFALRDVQPIEKQNRGGAKIETNEYENKNTLRINFPSQRIPTEIAEQRIREEAIIRVSELSKFTGHRGTYWW